MNLKLMTRTVYVFDLMCWQFSIRNSLRRTLLNDVYIKFLVTLSPENRQNDKSRSRD